MMTIIALLLALSVSGQNDDTLALDLNEQDVFSYFCLSSPGSVIIPDSTVVWKMETFNHLPVVAYPGGFDPFPAGHWDLDKGCYINHVEWDKDQQINSQDLFISEPINENSDQIDSTEYGTCESDLEELQTQLGLLSARIDELEGGGCDPVTAAKCSTCGTSAAKHSDYRGTESVTKTGLTCQKWTSQKPNSHTYTPENYPGMGLGDHNYCRNPSFATSGERTWCYTTDGPRWEYCAVRTCDDGEAASKTSGTGSTPLIVLFCVLGAILLLGVLYLVRKRRVAAATPDETPQLDTEAQVEA